MHRLLYGSFLLILAFACVIATITGNIVSWFNLGVVFLLLGKGLFWVRMRSKPKDQDSTTMKSGFTLLAAGYFIATLLFIMSGLVGEGWFGYLAAPVFATSAIAMAFVARSTSKPYETGEQE